MEPGKKKRPAVPDSQRPVKKNKTNKRKKTKSKGAQTPIPSTSGVIGENSFQPLAQYDPDAVVLVDSDNDESQVNRGENNTHGNTDTEATEHAASNTVEAPINKAIDGEGIKHNADFISFDFSESESDNEHFQDKSFEYDNYDSDNNYLSNDDGKTYHKKSRSKLNSEYPWLQNHDHTSKMEIVDWLNFEIKDFVNYISPSKEEISLRNEVYKKIKYLIITQLWNDCDVQVFGSFATDLYLPGSDIDMVITSDSGKYDTRAHLYQLSAFLRKTGLGVNVETIAKAKVPIIKFVEPDSKIHIDISFERTNGLTAARNIRHWLNTTPGLRELVLIVKQFLAVRKLNNVHVGGLGGYSIICLVYSFLRSHPRLATHSIDPMENLGILLIEFFELYGLNFGYDNVAIAFDLETKEPSYVPKALYPDLLSRNTFAIAIRDPDDPSNNISRGSFNIRDIKRSFGGAFQLLANKCYELNEASYKARLNQSILGGVIKYKGKERDFEDARNDVANEAMAEHDSASSGLPPLPSEARKMRELAAQENNVMKRKLKRLKQAEARKARRESVDQVIVGDAADTSSDDSAKSALKSVNDAHYYSDYSSSGDEAVDELVKVYNDSQDPAKKTDPTPKTRQADALFGIKSEESSDEADEESAKADVEDISDSDDDSAAPAADKVDKAIKRDYWSQKGGM